MPLIRTRRSRIGPILLTGAAIIAVGCGRPASTPVPAQREQAYRLNNQGTALLERFDYGPAAERFRQALTLDGSLAIARVNLSLALLYAQDLSGAAREAAEAARLLPSAPQPSYVLGLVARAENRTSDAITAFERVAAIDPDDVGTNVNLGQIYLEQRQYGPAITVLRKAVASEPYNVSAAYNLGLALTRDNQSDGADVLARAQALRTVGYATTYGTGYLEQGRYAEALTSTGAEPDLVDTATPATSFTYRAVLDTVDTQSPPSPFGRQFVAADLTPAGARAIAAGLGGCLALIDIEGDGDLDLFTAGEAAEHLYRNDGRDTWTDVSNAAGIGAAPVSAPAVGCVVGDYDNDGFDDLFVARAGTTTLYRGGADGRLTDVTRRAGIPAYPFLPGAAAMVDVDHDGDLDLVVAGLADIEATRRRSPVSSAAFPADFVAAPIVLWRNDGNGRFNDSTRAAGLQLLAHAVAIVPSDFDNRRDVDLLVVNRGGAPVLLQNQRDGTFKDVAAETGASAAELRDTAAVALGDIDNDDAIDLFLSGADRAVFAMGDGRGRFQIVEAPPETRGAQSAQLLDYDNDGLLDLVCWTGSGLRVLRHVGDVWRDVSQQAVASANDDGPRSPRGLAAADLDADGALDFVTLGRRPAIWRNSGTPGRQSLRITLRGRVSNRLGIGAKLQMRAGSLRARLEASAAAPAVAPRDIVFGLGARSGADAVRVLWPSGTLQAELGTTPEDAPAGTVSIVSLSSPLRLEELDRKPSSCPFLYTWNGSRFEFLTDFMGGGELGYWEAPGVRNVPDPLEYVRITGDRLQPKDGRFELRVTNELEETLFADRLALVAIAHPRDLEIYPDEGMTTPPKEERLFAVADTRVPQASDEHGHDVTERVAALDRRYADDFLLERFRGYARPHSLTLDLGSVSARPLLLLTGWTDYAFSSDNVAAHQAGLSLTPPALEVMSRTGEWRRVLPDIGIPVGRPQTVTVDLTRHLRPGEHRVRIVTNMRIYWDQVRVGTVVDQAMEKVSMHSAEAVLRERGFSAEVRPDGQNPPGYDYTKVSLSSPWKTLPGRYTRPGDVRELLLKADDQFVIAKPGDEIALTFDATSLAPLPDGWTRTFLLVADGFSREMDINSANPDSVGPLPFHNMTRYPYPATEPVPDSDAYRRYQELYNTRVVVRDVLPIDTLQAK